MTWAVAARVAAAASAIAMVSAASPALAQARKREALQRELQDLTKLAADLEQRTSFVVDQWGRAGVADRLGEMERRFSEAEIQFLLENYNAAAVFLYDVVDRASFQASSHYPDALYYLAESLYQQQSYVPSRMYFARLLEHGAGRYGQDALARLIEISGNLQDFTGVDRHVDRLRASGAPLRPQVLYVYGKFLHSRRDLPDNQRIARALNVFAEIPTNARYDMQARYFMGVLYVEAGDLESARQAFESIVPRQAKDAKERSVKELTWIALGRLYYETGELDAAIDAYQRVERQSPHYYQSLYEVAWTYVKKKDYQNALRACEILMVGAADSPLAPEAQILIGNLQARRRRYKAAVSTYNKVINEYAPVRDEIDALLSLHDDPVKYFNELIREEGEAFSVESILPPVAVKWASTERDVTQAVSIVADLETGNRDVVEGKQIADRILASLDAGTLEPFPALADGHARATEIYNAVLKLQARLAGLEQQAIEGAIPPALQSELTAARTRREQLEAAFARLPTSETELDARNARWLESVALVEREAYRQKMAAASLNAQLVAIRKWINDTRAQRTEPPEEIEAFFRRLDQEKAVADQLEAEADQMLTEALRMRDAVRLGTAGSREKGLRAEYQQAIEAERAVMGRVRVASTPEVRSVLDPTEQLNGRASEMIRRVSGVIADVNRRAGERRAELRAQVLAEVQRLDGYGDEVQLVMGDTKNLVGRIALNSFKRVQHAFYTLILKADVGIIDVAWARKTDTSKEIQRLAQDKDHQLKLLDREFEEVLEVDK